MISNIAATIGVLKTITITAPLVEPGRRLAYLDFNSAPDSDRVLVCVHGLTRNANDFDHIARALSTHYRVISVDIAGRGNSGYLRDVNNYNYHTYVNDILFLLDRLNVRTIDWIGSSMGGIIGIMIAGMYRTNLIRRIVLNDIGPVVPDTAMSYLINDMPKLFKQESYTRAEYDYIAKKTLSGWGISGSLMEELMNNGVSICDERYRLRFDLRILETLERWHDVDQAPMLDIWQNVRVPVFLMWGARSIFVTSESVKEMCKIHSELTICKCLRCGHVCSLMEIEQIVAIENWLNGLPVVEVIE